MSDDDPGKSFLKDRYRYKPMGAAYQGAMESVFAVVLAAGVGYWVDARFESAPWGVAIGATIGFAAFVLRLTRLGRAIEPSPEDETSDQRRSPPDGSAAPPAPPEGDP